MKHLFNKDNYNKKLSENPDILNDFMDVYSKLNPQTSDVEYKIIRLRIKRIDIKSGELASAIILSLEDDENQGSTKWFNILNKIYFHRDLNDKKNKE